MQVLTLSHLEALYRTRQDASSLGQITSDVQRVQQTARVVLLYISAASWGEVLERTFSALHGTDAEIESLDCRAHEMGIIQAIFGERLC